MMVERAGLDSSVWHALDPPIKPARTYKSDRQLLFGRTKPEDPIRYLGIEVDHALAISQRVEL
jgi:hypothetical protein